MAWNVMGSHGERWVILLSLQRECNIILGIRLPGVDFVDFGLCSLEWPRTWDPSASSSEWIQMYITVSCLRIHWILKRIVTVVSKETEKQYRLYFSFTI